jgi:hypothetical protein
LLFKFVSTLQSFGSEQPQVRPPLGPLESPPSPPQPLQRRRGIERLSGDEVAARLALKFGTALPMTTPVNTDTQPRLCCNASPSTTTRKGSRRRTFAAHIATNARRTPLASPRGRRATSALHTKRVNGPRLLFLSLDSGSAEVDPSVKTLEAVRRREVNCDVNALPRNKHWYLTHELA